jgi:hypothetical protein
MNFSWNQYVSELRQLSSIIPQPNLEILPLGV